MAATGQEGRVPNRQLDDDRIQLVRYTVVTLLRGRERILETGERLVTEALTAEAFVAWVTAGVAGGGDLPPDADRFLRVHYQVLDSWPKPDLGYEERQLGLLEDIATAVDRRRRRPARRTRAPRKLTPPQPGAR